MIRRVALATGVLAGALGAAPARAAPDRVYAVGRSGWTSERFGSGLAVLRAKVAGSEGGEAGGETGALLLTCDGAERRLRIAFPEPLAAARNAVPARLLVARPPSAAEGGFKAASTLEEGRRVSLADGLREPGETAVLRFVRLLRTRPERLTLLMSVGPAAPVLARVIPIHLVFVFEPKDRVALDDVAAACGAGPAGPPRADAR